MTENQLSKIIVDKCYNIHVELGPGLFESVYENVLAYELHNANLHIESQKGIPLVWDDLTQNMH
jgi:GxxExxY protein